MSETLVEDSTSYPGSIQVPEDGDARNAASVVVGMQGLANRFANWKSKFVDALLSGGAIDILNTLTYNIAAATDIFFGGSGHVKFTCTSVVFDRNVSGPLFEGGNSGRAPKKTLYGTPSTDQSVNAALYDELIYTPTAHFDLTITGSLVEGDHLLVINFATVAGRTVGVPGVVTVPVAVSSSHPSWVELRYHSGTWGVARIYDAAALVS